jgi:hypothetical protein
MLETFLQKCHSASVVTVQLFPWNPSDEAQEVKVILRIAQTPRPIHGGLKQMYEFVHDKVKKQSGYFPFFCIICDQDGSEEVC